MQFKAGYIADSIAKVINDFKTKLNKNQPDDLVKLDQINGLLQYVSSFDVEFPYNHNPDFKKLNPVLATINNIITRGLPTKAPICLEEKFAEIGITRRNDDESEIDFSSLGSQISDKSVFDLLHVIEPQLEIPESNYAGNPGSKSEWLFLHEKLKAFPFLKQILQSQRNFATINRDLGGGKSVDFSYEFPYLNTSGIGPKRKGIIFEFDGNHHETASYKYYDKYRDNAADSEGFETLRQASDMLEVEPSIINYFKKEIFHIFKSNYNKKLDIKLLTEYSLLFIPFAVARVQKTVLEFLLVHPELFNKEKIEIAIIERDLPCGAIAIKSLEELFFNINAILDDKDKLLLPEISLTVFENSKWVIDKKLHLQKRVEDESFFKQNEFDIVIDHSILRRSNIYKEADFLSDKAIKIRSSHFFDTAFEKMRRVYCAELLHYKALVKKKDDGSYIPVIKYEDNINFFIQTIFRKVGFREGQLPIISRALQQKPVIGLLPTGGGKSLTFQLPTFLQPGLCLVVDPIKSLMEDQVRVLKQNWIDCCEFINSNLKREERVKKLIDFRYGETMFLFVSPERFVMQDFRNIIRTIDVSKFGLAFSYCVIDEVHCVSEWGHDFRSTYLMLGKNAQRFAKTKTVKAVSLIGLTATASFDVLADIERELQIQHNDVADAIIMIENTIRPELFFRVTDVTGKTRMNELNTDFANIPSSLNNISNETILKASQLHHFNEFEKRDFASSETRNNKDESTIEFQYNDKFLLPENIDTYKHNDLSSIVFCPTKGSKRNKAGEIIDTRGVPYVFEKLTSNTKGFFYATDDDNINTEVQKHFFDFINGRVNHIVCTKAFGMGIDKSNIRSTYHYYYSGSLESLVQEAGRSGRDKKISEANILVSKDLIFRISPKVLLYQSPDNNSVSIIKDTFHRKALRKLLKEDGFQNKDSVTVEIDNVVNNLRTWNAGQQVLLPINVKNELSERFKAFIEESYSDRDIHNYFFNGSFKGVDVEYSQIYSLFMDREFEISTKLKELTDEYNEENETDYIFKYWSTGNLKRLYISDIEENDYGFINLALPLNAPTNKILIQILDFLKEKNGGNDDVYNLISEKVITELNEGTLKEVFESTNDNFFKFTITAEKIFPDNNEAIYTKITHIPNQSSIQHDFIDYINAKINAGNLFTDVCTINNGYTTILFNWFSVKSADPVITELENLYNASDSAKILKTVYLTQIEKSRKISNGYMDFLLLLEENIKNLKFSFEPNNVIEKWLKLYYHRSRYFKPTNDTGRLIYRMHSMGFLEDYEIDYNKNNLYYCTFRKYNSIEPYLSKIENYLRRYLSENSALELINNSEHGLKNRVLNNPNIKSVIDQVRECLYFLSEFSYKEIASKRKRATDEIENVLNTSITEPNYISDWFQQNLYIKEQIFFYFNAKYARIGFRINGKPFSLLDDYQEQVLDKQKILDKYLEVYRLDGAEQNNYKHMMGSCKKILRSLSETDLNNEWLLRLLKAFSMYSVNNASYISEANTELELGFDNLYKDESFHKNDFEIIEPIFESYFAKLHSNIQEDNPSFKDIKLIRAKLLLKMQTLGIEKLINRNQELTAEYYA